MKITLKFKLMLLLGCVLLIGFVWVYLAFKDYQRRHFEGKVPAVFELADAALISEEMGCGVAIFRLSDVTAKKIHSVGRPFFEGATKARTPNKEGNGEWYSTYMDWKPTPIPANWITEGTTWIYCFYDDQMVHKIIEAGKNSGSYYTSSAGGRAKLVVVPSLDLIAYSFLE